MLPSGVVVHLDNLNPPLLGKLVEKSINAKIEPLVSAGKDFAQYPSISEPISSACNSFDRVTLDASSLRDKEWGSSAMILGKMQDSDQRSRS